MDNEILAAYQRDRAKRPGSGGKAPEITEDDKRVARIAAQYSEEDLRHATVMRASFNREASK